MEEHDQDKEYSEIDHLHPERYSLIFSTSNVPPQMSQSRFRQELSGNPASARPQGNGADTSSNYNPDPASTFPCSTAEISASQISYAAEYDSTASTRQQADEFGGYNTGMLMYNVPQTSAQASLYNPSNYLSTLQSRNSQMQPVSFAPSQSHLGQSYLRNEVTEVSESSAIGQHPSNPSAPSDATYFQNIPSSLQYTGGDEGESGSISAGASSLAAVEGLYQLAESDMGSGVMPESAAHEAVSQTSGLGERFHDYQRQLANIFQDITVGNLGQAADNLLSVSFWLLSRVGELGLTDDDESLHSDRIKLWQDFNHAWLALAFKQKQYMLGEHDTSQVSQPLSRRTLKELGDELIRLCDGVERHGLVDYQLGVWEDEIESLLEDCLNLFDENNSADGSDVD